MIVPANSRPTASASADLPLAVGPAISSCGRVMVATGALLAEPAAAIVGPMESVLTLVTNPDQSRLNKTDVAAAGASLDAIGAVSAAPDWLASDIACDLAFAGPPPALAQAAVAAAPPHPPIDVHAPPAPRPRQRRPGPPAGWPGGAASAWTPRGRPAPGPPPCRCGRRPVSASPFAPSRW